MRTTASILAATTLATAALLSTGEALWGQTLQGTVMELGSDRPLGSASVQLLDATVGEVLEEATTESSGFFRLQAPEPGEYWVKVQSLGHVTTTDGPAVLTEGDTLDVQFRIRIAALRIDGITVWAEAQSRRLESSGFYERENQGIGVYMTREEMDEIFATDPSDYLRRMAGVTVYPGQGIAPAQVLVRRDCRPTIYLDGIQVNFSIDEVVDVESIEGIEVYRGPSEIPLQYSVLGACGVVLVWTR